MSRSRNDSSIFFDLAGNPLTLIAPDNFPRSGSPCGFLRRNLRAYAVLPFPDYISGHSTFSGAAARILARFYGRDDIAFVTGSDALPGVTRSFAGFSAAAAEAGVSRIYGGIHYSSANQDGLAAGAAIGDVTFANVLQPKRNRSRN